MIKSKISIIVPFYNNGKDALKCINSIKTQTYQNFEALMIDDGSTDDTKYILQSVSKEDERFRYIYKQNGGVSSARNEGLRRAKGEYITFVDSDDYLDSNIIDNAIKAIENYDLVIWGCNRISDGFIVSSDKLANKNVDINDLINNLICTQKQDYGKFVRACWGKLYRSKIIKDNQLEFDEKLYIGEDALFVISYLNYCKKTCSISCPGYYYLYSQSSATSKYKRDFLEQNLQQISKLQDALSSLNEYDDSIYSFKLVCLDNLLNNSLTGLKRKEISLKEFLSFVDAKNFYSLQLASLNYCYTFNGDNKLLQSWNKEMLGNPNVNKLILLWFKNKAFMKIERLKGR